MLSVSHCQNAQYHFIRALCPQYHYTDRHAAYFMSLGMDFVIMLSVIVPHVIMLNVIVLNVILLSVLLRVLIQ